MKARAGKIGRTIFTMRRMGHPIANRKKAQGTGNNDLQKSCVANLTSPSTLQDLALFKACKSSKK